MNCLKYNTNAGCILLTLFAIPWYVACQASPPMGFSRKEYWSGLPFPSPSDLPDPGIEPGSPTFWADSLLSEPAENPLKWSEWIDSSVKKPYYVIFLHEFIFIWASLVAQTVKNPSATWETWVQSLSWEDPLEEGMATHSSILAWRIPMDRGACQATVHGVANMGSVRQDWVTKHTHMFIQKLHSPVSGLVRTWSIDVDHRLTHTK